MGRNERVVPVTALKASLSRYLRQVKAGEEVVVTERNKPVAKIIPIAGRPRSDAHLVTLEREGRIRLGTGALDDAFWQLPRAKDPKGRVRRALLEEREQSP